MFIVENFLCSKKSLPEDGMCG